MSRSSPAATRAPGDDARPGHWILTAFFLATSWTWCIGMFLPALLVGDFGLPGWIVFAFANCLGAAGTGLALAAPGAAARFRHDHRVAAGVFSLVTIAFHAFFLSWIGAEWLTPPTILVPASGQNSLLSIYLFVADNHWLFGWLLAGAAYLAALALSFARFASLTRLAVVVWSASILLVAAELITPTKASTLPPLEGYERAKDLLWLAPAIVFGFALCPSLDLTILRARETTPGRPGGRAFVVGFLILFPVMILLSLLYAGRIIERWQVGLFLAAHLIAQSVFTMGAHLGEVRRATWPAQGWARGVALLAPLAAAAVPPMLMADLLNLDAYRLFLGFYALAAPAYVWIVCIPRAGAPSRAPGAAPVLLWAIAALAASPFLWLGVLERQWWAVAPAVGIPLAAPLVARAFQRRTA